MSHTRYKLTSERIILQNNNVTGQDFYLRP